jgi:hypothetical protein
LVQRRTLLQRGASYCLGQLLDLLLKVQERPASQRRLLIGRDQTVQFLLKLGAQTRARGGSGGAGGHGGPSR